MKKIAAQMYLSFLLSGAAAFAGPIQISWDLPTTATTPADVSVVNASYGLSGSQFSRGPALTATNSSSGWGAQNWTNGTSITTSQALASGNYFQWQVTVASGYTLSLDGFQASMFRSASGAGGAASGGAANNTVGLFYSLDGFASTTNLVAQTGSISSSSSTPTSVNSLGNPWASTPLVVSGGQTITFRLAAFYYNATAVASGTLRFLSTGTQDVALTGTLINQNLPYIWNGGTGDWAVGSAGWDAGNWVNGKDAQITNQSTLTIGSGVVAGAVTAGGSSDINFQGSAGLAAAALTKSGSGKLSLGVIGTYTNGITINGGIVEAGVNSALNGNITLNAGGTLAAGTTLNSIGNLVVTDGNITGSGTITPTLTTVTASTGSNISISTVIAGTGSLTKAGAGTTTLSGSNTYSGVTEISAGLLATSGNEKIPDGSLLRFSANGSTNRLGGNETVRGLETTTTSITGAILDLQTFNFSFGTGSTSNSFAGSIQGSGNVTKTGTGIQSWDSMHTFTGNMILQDGSIRMQGSGSRTTNSGVVTINSNAFGRGKLVIQGGRIYSSSAITSGTQSRTVYNPIDISANFALGFSNASVGQTGDMIVSTNVTGAATTLLASATLTADSFVDWQQNITGAGFNLTKAGPSLVTFSGNNTFNTLEISQGNAVLSGSNTINSFTVGAGNTLTVSNNAALGSGSLTLQGTAANAAVLVAAQPATSLPVGALNLSGNSTVTMDSSKSISSSGAITLSGGTNVITLTGNTIANGTFPLATGISINKSGGSLAVNGAAVLNANVTLDGAPVTVARSTYTLTSTDTTLNLQIDGNPFNLVWGTGSTWDTNAASWLRDGAGDSIAFVANDNVTFSNSGATAIAVDTGGVVAGTLLATNSSGSVDLSGGSISALSLDKGGAGSFSVGNNLTLTRGLRLTEGTLTLGGSNTISGGVTNSGGLLVVNHANALGTNTLILSNGGSFSAGVTPFTNAISIGAGGGAVTNNTAMTLSGALTGGGNTLTKRGTGALTLSGAVGASGSYLVLDLQEGDLVLNGGSPKYFTNSTVNGNLVLSNSVINTRGSILTGTGNILVFGTSSWSNITSAGTVANKVILQPGASLTSSNSGNLTLAGGLSGTGNVTAVGSSGLYITGADFQGEVTNSSTDQVRFNESDVSKISAFRSPNFVSTTTNATTGVVTTNNGILVFSNSTADREVGGLITGGQLIYVRGNKVTTFTNLNNTFSNSININGSVSGGTGKFVGTGSMGSASATAEISLGNTNNLHLDGVASVRNVGFKSGGGTIFVAGDSTLGNVTNNTSGGQSFTKDGTGKLTFTGLVRDDASTNAPLLNLKAGRVTLGATGSNAAVAQYISITNTNSSFYVGDLELLASNQLSMQGSGTMGGGGKILLNGDDAAIQTSSTSANNGAVLILQNDVVLGAGAGTRANLAATTSNSLVLNRVLGTGDLYFGIQATGGGGGTIVLSNTLSFTGNVFLNLSTNGVLRADVANAFANGQGLVMNRTNSNNVIESSGIFDLNGNSQSLAFLQSLSNNPAFTGVITSSVAATLTVNQSVNTTYGGALVGAVSLVKSGTGALTLVGPKTYSGTTAVTGGSLVNVSTDFTATITPSQITVTFSNIPQVGNTFQIVPAALSGSYGNPTVNNLGAAQTTAFNASTGVLTIAQATLAPANLSYGGNELSATNGSAMTTVTPTCDNSPTSYSITPALPDGLIFSTVDGSIGGTPTVASSRSLYTVTAINSGGSTPRAIYLTVAKATPSITAAPTASAITSGQALSSSTLSGGTGSVAGSFAWTDSTFTPAVGTSSQSVTFTPNDTANYNTATTNVSVTVNSAGPTFAGAYAGKSLSEVAPNGLTYLMNYAFGGDSSNAPTLPSQDTADSTKLVLVAVVRTNDTNVSVVGEVVGSLADYANPSSITAVNGTTNYVPQTNLPAGCERRKYSVDQGSNDRQFLRLKAIQK